MRVKVLLVDDDPALSQMLSTYLEGEGIGTTPAFNGPMGVSEALSGKYDAVILDMMLPGMDGVEVLRKIREASDVPVLILTAKGGGVDRVIGLEMGADDYVAKPYFPRELVARLRAILRRQRPSGGRDRICTLGALWLSAGKREVTWDGQAFELTTSEFDMLERMMRAGENVSTKDELSQEVLGRRRESYDRSVDVHINNLRKKLAQCTGGNAEIENIRGVGYRLRLK
jgi:two-component system OmpR family response regulator